MKLPSTILVSWKTSLAGAVFALGSFVILILSGIFFIAHCGYVGHFRWCTPRAIYGLASLGCLLIGAGGMALGLCARDHDKSSEDAGIKPKEPQP